MANTIKLKSGSGNNPSASDLVVGEVALRTDGNPKLFTKNDAGNVVEVGLVESGSIVAGTIVNADINASAAIAGSKIDPDFTGQIVDCQRLQITHHTPLIKLIDNNNDSDFDVMNQNGIFKIFDRTNSAARLTVASDGTTTVLQNLDVGAGLDVTGDISVTGTVDGVDIAARNTLFGGLTSSSGVLSNGVTATTQSAGDNSTKVATTAYTDTAISNLVDSSPSTLNTLNELAAALGDDANFSTTVTNSIATKLPLAGGTLTGDLTINESHPSIFFVDSGDNPDYEVGNHDGAFVIQDDTNGVNRLVVNSDGHIDIAGNLDVGSGIDVTGASTFEATTFTGNVTLTSVTPQLYFTDTNHDPDYAIWNHNGVLRFLDITNSSATRLEIQASGLVKASNSFEVTGNIVVSGNVDGRDVASDGTKLDGIESNATADQTASEILSLLSNQNILTSGTLKTTGNAVIIEGADPKILLTDTNNDSDFRILNENGVFKVYDQTNSAARFTILSNGRATLANDAGVNGNLDVGSGLDVTGVITATSHIDIPDDAEIKIGTHDDLRLLHDGSNSIIDDAGEGVLSIRSDTGINILKRTGDEFMIRAIPDGAVELYWDNEAKILTKTNGATIQDLTASGAYLDIKGSDGVNGKVYGVSGTTIGFLDNQNHFLLKGVKDGAVSLYFDNSPKLSTTTAGIDVDGSITCDDIITAGALLHEGDTNTLVHFDQNDNIALKTNGSTRLRVTNAGAAITGTCTATTFSGSGASLTNIPAAQLTGTLPALDGSNLTGLTVNNANTLDNLDSTQFLRSDQNDTFNGVLKVGGSSVSGGEGGEIQLTQAPSGSLSGSTVNIDINGNNFRIFEDSGNTRGFFLDVGQGGNNATGKIFHSGNDGSGSGLDSDTLDGVQGSSYLRSDAVDSSSQNITINGLEVGSWALGTAFKGIFHTSQSGQEYMMINADGHTYISATTSHNVYIRNGGNDSTNQLIVGSGNGGLTWRSNTVFHVGNDGSGSGLDADKLDGLEGSEYVRSNADDTLTGSTYTFSGNVNEKIILSGASYPFIRFQEGTTDKAYIQWHADGYIRLRNEEAQDELRVGNGNNGLVFAIDGTARNVFHTGNDGSGSGLDSDTLDGVQGSSYLRSDANDTYTGTLTLSSATLGASQSIFVSGATNFDNLKNSGFYSLYNVDASGHTNAPFKYGAMISAGNTATSLGMAMQIAHERLGAGTFIRGMNDTNDAWHSWYEMWTSGTDGAGSGLDSDTVDGLQASSFLRSDANDVIGGVLSYHSNEARLQFRNTSYNTYLYIGGWDATNSNDISRIRNSNANLHLDSGANGSLYLNHYSSGNVYARQNIVFHAGNDGSGSGLDADTVDGLQASGFVRSDTSDTMNGELQISASQDRQIVLNKNIGSPSNYYNALQMEVRATSGTAGIGLHRAGHSHVGMYTNAQNVLKFDYNAGTVTLNHNTGSVFGSGNDGSGSGLDSDLLDGQQGSYYKEAGTLTGNLPNRIGLGTSVGGTPGSRAAFLALGDNDTGVGQNGDGQLELWANNQEIVNIDTNGTVTYKRQQVNQSSSTDLVLFLNAVSTGYVGDGLKFHGFRSATSANNFCAFDSGHAGTADREFTLRGDGNAFADGTWNNNGADYAEFFESSTGSAIPVGTTVVLENNKVRAATSSDAVGNIIGVVRPKAAGQASMTIGNTAWNKWHGKYLTDDFDCFILDDHNVIEWTDADGKLHSYESHTIPSDVTVPSDATTSTHDSNGNKYTHYRLNPDFDSSKDYIPRHDRDEWIIVGLVGQVKTLKGQIVNDRWIKMRDVSDTVEEYFIR